VAKITKDGFDRVDAKFFEMDKKIETLTTAVDGLAQGHLKFDAEPAAERAARERLMEK